MITAYSETTRSNIRVEHLINKGEYFGETYLIGRQCGFEMYTFIVEASCEQSAIDVFVDSKYGHLVIIDDPQDIAELNPDYISYCGNEGKPCDLDLITILERVKVNYFAKPTN